MKIPPFSLPTSLQDIDKSFDALTGKIPADMKTISVERRHILTITHAVPQHRVLERLPQLPPHLALDTLKVAGESCALLQSVLVFNDNFRYTPLPMPKLDFWQLDFRVLVHETTPQTTPPEPTSSTRSIGAWSYQTLVGTRVAWALQRAVAGEATFADFNVIVRGPAGHEYAAYIADIVLNGDATTQLAVRATDEKPFAAPFVNWTKMTEFLLARPRAWSRFSVGEKIGALTLQAASVDPIAAEFMPVGGEIREARFGLWESSGVLNAGEMRQPFSILLQPHSPTTLVAPSVS